MKKLFWLLLLAPVLLLGGTAKLEALIQKAAAEDKLAMVFIETDDCPWCKRMKERTFANRLVADKLEADVVVEYFNKDREELPRLYQARTVPTIHLLDSKGQMLMTIPGFMPPGPFLQKIEEAQKSLDEEF